MNETPLANPAARSTGSSRIIILVSVTTVLVVGALLVPIPFSGRAAIAIGDFVHAPLFGGVTLGILTLLQRIRPLGGIGKRLAIRCLSVALVTFTLGVLIEFLQMNLGRSAAVHDAIANGLGIIAAVFWYWARQLQRERPHQSWLRRSFLLACGFLLGLAWWSPVTMLRDVAAVQMDFPLLATFESRAQLQRFYFRECNAKLTRQDATAGKYAMEVTYEDKPYPAATIIEMVSDWSGMRTLELDVALDKSYTSGELSFMVKVIDELHRDDHNDTFRTQWLLTPGQPQHIRIEREQLIAGPDTRELDLSKIKYVDLMVLDPGQSVTLRIDTIRLTVD